MNLTKKIAALVLAAGAVFALSACGDPMQKYNDAPKSGQTNNVAADVVTMPDGFSNLATKCDHGNRIYSAYHGADNKSAALAVVPNDPTCSDS